MDNITVYTGSIIPEEARQKLTPHFLPAQRPDDNWLAMASLRRIEGMLLLESKSPGIIPQGSFETEFATLKRYVAQELDGKGDADQMTQLVYKRAAETVMAILEDPEKPEHSREATVAIQEARRNGYGAAIAGNSFPKLPGGGRRPISG